MSSPNAQAVAWLAKADPNPDHALLWLSKAKIVLLPLGRSWSVVRVREHRGLVAASALTGPVIHDPIDKVVLFVVPVDTDWHCPGTELLGNTCWLAVPNPSVIEPPGAYWLNVPDGSGRLVDTAQLRQALGPRLLAEAFG